MKLVAEVSGVRHELGEPKLVDFVWFERQFGVSAGAMSESPKMEYMVFLAFCALKRRGVVAIDAAYSDAFLITLDSLEDEDAEDDAEPTGNPTEADQPTG